MRTLDEINDVYFNLVDAQAKIGLEHLTGIKDGYEMKKQANELDMISHLKMCFDNCWTYLDDDQKNKICDLSTSYFYN